MPVIWFYIWISPEFEYKPGITLYSKYYFKHNCLDWYNKEDARCNGVYEVFLTKNILRSVYCYMEGEGGGWMAFQRRFDGTVDSMAHHKPKDFPVLPSHLNSKNTRLITSLFYRGTASTSFFCVKKVSPLVLLIRKTTAMKLCIAHKGIVEDGGMGIVTVTAWMESIIIHRFVIVVKVCIGYCG